MKPIIDHGFQPGGPGRSYLDPKGCAHTNEDGPCGATRERHRMDLAVPRGQVRRLKRLQQCPSLAPAEALGAVRLLVNVQCSLLLTAENQAHAGACMAMVAEHGRVTWRRADPRSGSALRVFWIGTDCWVATSEMQAKRFAVEHRGSWAAATSKGQKKPVELPMGVQVKVVDALGREAEKPIADWLREFGAGGMLGSMEDA